MLNNSSHTTKKILIFDQKHTLSHWIPSIFLSPCVFAPKSRANEFCPDLASPNSVLQKWCLSLLSIVMIKLQVRVLRLMKMHGYLNVPPCIICTPCFIWFRHGTSGIFGLWAFRKYILLCVSNVHNKEYAPLKKIDAFFSILVWNIFSDLYVTCGHI